MPSPYQLKLSAQRIQNMLKRVWNQKNFYQQQEQKQANQLQREFNEKMIKLNRCPRPSFRRQAIDENEHGIQHHFRIRPSRKTLRAVVEKTRRLKPLLKVKPKSFFSHKLMQRAYLHMLGFFAKDASLQQKRLQEKMISKQMMEKKSAEQEQQSRLEF